MLLKKMKHLFYVFVHFFLFFLCRMIMCTQKPDHIFYIFGFFYMIIYKSADLTKRKHTFISSAILPLGIRK